MNERMSVLHSRCTVCLGTTYCCRHVKYAKEKNRHIEVLVCVCDRKCRKRGKNDVQFGVPNKNVESGSSPAPEQA